MRLREILMEAVTKRPWTFYHGTKSDAFQQFNPSLASKGEQYWNPLGDGMYVTNNPRFASNFGHNVHTVVIPAGSTYKRINTQMWQYSTGPGLIMRALRRAFKAVGENYDHWDHGVPVKSPDAKKLSREQIIDALVASYQTDIRANAAKFDTERLRQELIKRWKWNRESDRSGTAQIEGGEVMLKSKIIYQFKYHMGQTLRQNDPYTGLYECSHLVMMLFGQPIYEAFSQTLPAVSNEKFGKFDFVVFTETNDVFTFTDDESTSEVVIFNPALQRVQQKAA
jgi:hypothetical protein